MTDCEGESKFNNSCYKNVKLSNWFDAVDQCKSLGGSLPTINSLEEVNFFTGNFMNQSLFWLQDLGQFSYGLLSPSADRGHNVSLNETSESQVISQNETSATKTVNLKEEPKSNRTSSNKAVSLSEASEWHIAQEKPRLCPAFHNGRIFAVNCSTRQYSLCEIPGERMVGRKGSKRGGWLDGIYDGSEERRMER